MKSLRPFLILTAIFAAAFTGAPPPATPTYPIKITRPYKPGDAYTIHATFEGTDASTATIPGQPPQKEDHKYKVDFTARCDITDVDPFGAEKSFTLTIQNLSAGPDGKITMDAGKIINVTRNEKEVASILQGPGDVPEDVKKAIEFIYSPLNPTGIADDDVLGSKTPRKIGESWPINADVAVKQAANSVTIDPKNMTGTSTLKGIETVDGTRAARLLSTMNFTNARPSTLPKEITVDSSDFKITIGGLMPLDPALPPLEIEQSLELHMVCSGPANNPIHLDATAKLSHKSVITPVKK